MVADTQDASGPSNPALINAQLLIVRYLLGEGVRTLSTRLPHAAGLAVSLFQDSAELLLACIAHTLDARVSPQTRFMEYWDAIESAPLNKDSKKVPSKAALGRLNSMRVAFKHRGQLPLLEDADAARVDTEVFVKQSAATFLDIDIDEVSLTDLIQSAVTRKHVVDAQRCLARSEHAEGLQHCALAERSIRSGLPVDLPEVDPWRLGRALDGLDLGRSTRAVIDTVGYIANHLAAHRSAIRSLFSEREIARYRRFKALVPATTQFADGHIKFNWNRRAPEPEKAAEELKVCIDYIVEQTLRQQSIR